MFFGILFCSCVNGKKVIWGECAKLEILTTKQENLACVLLRCKKICEISGDSGQQGGQLTRTPLGPPWKINRPIKHQIHLRMSYCIQQQMYQKTHKHH